MGFSQVAAFAVLLTATLFFASNMAESWISTNREVNQSWQDAQDRAHDARNAAMTITAGSYNATSDQITLTINNTGTVGFNIGRLDVLVDGVPKDASSFSNITVDGQSTNVWPPWSILSIDVAQTTTPSAVVVVTDTGALGFWRSF